MDFKKKLETSYRANYGKWVKQISGGEVTQEMAEDAIQDACVKALSLDTGISGIEDFDNWFFSLVTKAVSDVVNKERRGGMVGRSIIS